MSMHPGRMSRGKRRRAGTANVMRFTAGLL